MRDDQPSKSAYLITAPSATERRYDLSVTVPHLKPARQVLLQPWLRITANVETEEITCAAGIKARKPDAPAEDDYDDGA